MRKEVQIKLIDFGFLVQAKKVDGQDLVAKVPKMKGTKGYFAPELLNQHLYPTVVDYDAQGEAIFADYEYTSKTDVWSLGCILWWMYTGTKQFTYRDARPSETTQSDKEVNTVADELASLTKKEFRVRLPPKFRISTVCLLQSMLMYDPKERASF